MPKKSPSTPLKKIDIVMLVAAVIGAVNAAYLTVVKFSNLELVCTPGLGDCNSVNNSAWSEVWGVPVALLGLLTFGALMALILLANRFRFMQGYRNLAIFGVSLIGFLFSLYLTYIEIFVLKTICQWCVLSTLMVTVIFVCAVFSLFSKHKN